MKNQNLELFSADEFSALEMIKIKGGFGDAGLPGEGDVQIGTVCGTVHGSCPNTYCNGGNCIPGCGK